MSANNNTFKKTLRYIGLVLILLFVYLIVAIPFKVMSVIPGFTDIRPVILLEPVYGIFFGIPGCIAFAAGNLVCDIVSDGLRWSSIAGFIINFAGPFLYWLFWNKISKESFSLKTGKNLLKQICTTLVIAVIDTVTLSITVKLSYPEIYGKLFAVTVLLNESVFPIFLGIPLMILMQEELGFKPKTLQRT